MITIFREFLEKIFIHYSYCKTDPCPLCEILLQTSGKADLALANRNYFRNKDGKIASLTNQLIKEYENQIEFWKSERNTLFKLLNKGRGLPISNTYNLYAEYLNNLENRCKKKIHSLEISLQDVKP
ncbi:MAG: hypothetical protein ACFFG0_09680 [Candidatus Thorarchaeota archaeon]